MANTTASSIITRALDNASRIGTGTARSGTTLTNKGLDWLNDIQHDMARDHNFRECMQLYTATCTASGKSYTFPSNFRDVIDVVLVDSLNSRKLQMVPTQTFLKRVPYPEDESHDVPRLYIPCGTCFDLFPIPDSAYPMSMRVTLWPTTITATTESVFFFPDKDDVLVAGVTYKLFQHLQMHDDAKVWKSDYVDLKKRAVITAEYYPDWEPYGMGFDSKRSNQPALPTGQYWNDPLVYRG